MISKGHWSWARCGTVSRAMFWARSALLSLPVVGSRDMCVVEVSSVIQKSRQVIGHCVALVFGTFWRMALVNIRFYGTQKELGQLQIRVS